MGPEQGKWTDRDRRQRRWKTMGTDESEREPIVIARRTKKTSPTIHLPRRGATCYRAPASWCAPHHHHQWRSVSRAAVRRVRIADTRTVRTQHAQVMMNASRSLTLRARARHILFKPEMFIISLNIEYLMFLYFILF